MIVQDMVQEQTNTEPELDTAAAVDLVRRLPWGALVLLRRVLEDALLRAAPPAAPSLLRAAADLPALPELLADLTDTDDEAGIVQLAQLAPLTSDESARWLSEVAVTLVRRQVSTGGPENTNSLRCLRSMLLYLQLHPALQDHHYQSRVSVGLQHLDNNTSGRVSALWGGDECAGGNIWSDSGPFRRTVGKNIEFRACLDTDREDLQQSFSKNGRDVDPDEEPPAPPALWRRSNSLTPPASEPGLLSCSSSENLSEEPSPPPKPRSFSLSGETGGASGRPLGALLPVATASETRLDALRSGGRAEPGMAAVGPWLKSLRLHKYAWLFSDLGYDQMLAVDEQCLERLGVTRGARHKLLLSIKRLAERDRDVARLQGTVSAGGLAAAGGPLAVLGAVRAALLAPMPPGSELPRALVTLLDTVSRALLSGASAGRRLSDPSPSGGSEEEWSVDPISLHCWLVEKALQHESFSSPELSDALKKLRYRLPPRQFYHRLHDVPPHRRPVKHSFSNRGRGGAGGTVRGRPKSHSLPQCPPHLPHLAHLPHHDIHSSLDALCLQMTEQAIN